MPKEADAAVIKTLHGGFIAEGEKVKEFREKVRQFLGTEYVIPMNSCTMALHIAYVLAGVKSGTEVITTPLTCIATNTPILYLGARIVWADSDPETGMIDPNGIEKLITNKTKAIVVLHKDGDLAKLDEILTIAKKHKIKVVEDAAHAFGAKYKGRMIGTTADYTCFSFQAIKHITTGDGGVLTCKNEEDFLLAKKLKWLGIDKEALVGVSNPWEADVDVLGYKGNMNDISATIGVEAMKYAPEIIGKYHSNGELYTELLKDVPGVKIIPREKDCYSTHWTYVLLVQNREKVISALATEGVEAHPVHLRNDVYTVFSEFKCNLPGVDAFASREISVPCGWWVLKEDIYKIVDIIKKNV